MPSAVKLSLFVFQGYSIAMPEPLTITAAAPLLRSGELTPSELLEQCLRRIDVYEPAVKAWVYLDRERARREAEELAEDIKAGHYRGELHGIPVGVKDIIDVFDMPTGCGSKLWANSYARQDAECVKRLRQAGALVLGKTVTTPYAFTDPPVTRNPWNLDRTPGGSSSGSAAAVACGMCLAALGTQTGGSLIRPASYCGVCCLKPTHGRVSVNGVLPLAPSLDHVGVMAGCVRDLAVVFQAVAGPTASGGFYLGRTGPVADCVARLDSSDGETPDLVPLGGMFADAQPAILEAFQRFRQKVDLTETATLSVPPAGFAEVIPTHRTMMAVEAADYHEDRLRRRPDEYGPSMRKLIEDGLAAPAVAYRRAVELQENLAGQVTKQLLGKAFVMPATSDLPPSLETTGDPRFNAPWSFTGNPVVSLPVEWIDGLPYAVQFVGLPTCEDDLFPLVAGIERAFALPRRLPPVPDPARGS